MSSREVAVRLGVTPSRLSRLMAGKTDADPATLSAIAQLTGCSVSPNDWVAWHGARVRAEAQGEKKRRA